MNYYQITGDSHDRLVPYITYQRMARKLAELAGRDETSFSPDQGQTLLTNLAEIAGVCLMAKLEAHELLSNNGGLT